MKFLKIEDIKVGDRINHITWGEVLVIDVRDDSVDYVYQAYHVASKEIKVFRNREYPRYNMFLKLDESIDDNDLSYRWESTTGKPSDELEAKHLMNRLISVADEGEGSGFSPFDGPYYGL